MSRTIIRMSIPRFKIGRGAYRMFGGPFCLLGHVADHLGYRGDAAITFLNRRLKASNNELNLVTRFNDNGDLDEAIEVLGAIGVEVTLT